MDQPGFHVMVQPVGTRKWVSVCGFFPATKRRQLRRAKEMSAALRAVGVPSHVAEGYFDFAKVAADV